MAVIETATSYILNSDPRTFTIDDKGMRTAKFRIVDQDGTQVDQHGTRSKAQAVLTAMINQWEGEHMNASDQSDQSASDQSDQSETSDQGSELENIAGELDELTGNDLPLASPDGKIRVYLREDGTRDHLSPEERTALRAATNALPKDKRENFTPEELAARAHFNKLYNASQKALKIARAAGLLPAASKATASASASAGTSKSKSAKSAPDLAFSSLLALVPLTPGMAGMTFGEARAFCAPSASPVASDLIALLWEREASANTIPVDVTDSFPICDYPNYAADSKALADQIASERAALVKAREKSAPTASEVIKATAPDALLALLTDDQKQALMAALLAQMTPATSAPATSASAAA